MSTFLIWSELPLRVRFIGFPVRLSLNFDCEIAVLSFACGLFLFDFNFLPYMLLFAAIFFHEQGRLLYISLVSRFDFGIKSITTA